jgi:hypothetical protein
MTLRSLSEALQWSSPSALPFPCAQKPDRDFKLLVHNFLGARSFAAMAAENPATLSSSASMKLGLELGVKPQRL